jgi:hypothetical protein
MEGRIEGRIEGKGCMARKEGRNDGRKERSHTDIQYRKEQWKEGPKD